MNEFKIILYSLIPALIYIYIAYLTTPYRSWKLKRALAYFITGTLSTGLVVAAHKIYPGWSDLYLETFDTTVYQVMFVSFIQIAFLEEISKYVLFYISRKQVLPQFKLIKKTKRAKKLTPTKIDSHPLSIMMYAGFVSLGFAFVENIKYAAMQGIDIIYIRSVFSMLLHMCCGMMMGYWISLADFRYRLTTNPTNDVAGISIFDVFMAKNEKLRKGFYLTMGLFTAVFFHGLFDFNIISVHDFRYSISDSNITFTITLVILTVAVLLVKRMMDHLIKLNLKIKTNK